jgi:APA family basic amino acid/polyamine antiporter
LTLFGHTLIGSTVNGASVGVVSGASILFFAYVGFDSVSTVARECVNPARDLPIGLIGSLLFSTLMYCGVSVVLIGLVPYQMIDTGAPFSAAFTSIGMPFTSILLSIGACTGITSVLMVTMMGQPRLCFAMARDRLLPQSLTHVNSYGIPDRGSLITCLSVCLLAGFLPMSMLVEMVSIGTLFAFVVVCLCVLMYRHTHPDVQRPFRCPWSPFLPTCGVVICFYLMLSLPITNWLRLIGWFLIGMIVYRFYGRQRYQDDDLSVKHVTFDQVVDQSVDLSIDADDNEQQTDIHTDEEYEQNTSDEDDALSVSRMIENA